MDKIYAVGYWLLAAAAGVFTETDGEAGAFPPAYIHSQTKSQIPNPNPKSQIPAHTKLINTMDSDDDGDDYGYDLPEGAGLGFSFSGTTSQPSHILGRNNDDGNLSASSSSAENNDSDDDDDDPNFAYGAYASRKRKKREHNSKSTDKERNLYGVFYEASDDDDEGHNKNKKSRRSRHFDRQSNRMAGLAFVKASTSSPGAGADASNNDDKEPSAVPGRSIDDTNVPSWLKEKQPQNTTTSPSQQDKQSSSKTIFNDFINNHHNSDDDDQYEIIDEEDAKIAQENEKRFKELIAIANKCTNPLSINNNKKTITTERRINSQRNNAQLENEEEGKIVADDRPAAGLGFASATKSSTDLHDNGSNFEGERNAGIGLGLGMTTKRNVETIIDQNQGLGIGLGMGSGFGLGMGLGATANNAPSPSQTMGMGLGSKMNDKPAKKRDPSLGKWEKHTKGIGMKLLQKMGYEGSGGLGAKRKRKPIGSAATTETDDTSKPASLGTNETEKSKEEVVTKRGISRPVEVVVRPTGLGLGYGSFKEQSQLKVNRQIEAEVRGLEPAKEKKEPKIDTSLEGIPKSLLPSTQSLLDKGTNSWRMGKGNKKVKRKIVNYQEILDKSAAASAEGKMQIIDMRGPSATVVDGRSQSTNNVPAVVPLGEELLHNVTLLLNTHESQLRTSSYMEKSAERKISSLEEECNEMINRKEGIDNRITKMKFALEVLEEAEKLIDALSTRMKDNNCDELDFAMDGLKDILAKLYDNFSKEERKSLNFESTLVPSIVQPVIEAVTSSLNPLSIEPTWMNHLATGIDKLCIAVGSDNKAYSLREMIFTDIIVPWISSAMSSSKWDPIVNVEIGLKMHEALLTCVDKSFLGAEVEENKILKHVIHREIIQNGVQPKLQRAISYWKPKLDENNVVSNPMHHWILPWLPHFRNESALGTMFADIRRSLKKTLSFISKHEPDDVAFFSSCIVTLRDWKKLFEESTIFSLTSELVTPRFARCLARMPIEFSEEQSWDQIHALYDYFDTGLMSADDFLSLLEGEILASWAYTLHCALLEENKPNLSGIAKFYSAWKERLFGQPSECTKSHLALRGDLMVCRYFFGGLEMIRASVESNKAKLDSLLPPNPKDCNYRIALMHRSKAKKPVHAEANVVSSPSQRKHQVDGNAASFADVVADFARHHDIDFYPKVGSNTTKDGKKVYMFGNHPVYFDKNVLFTLRGAAWQPISLEHLAQAC
jgi:tuftelin-interacting protein 11